MLGAPHNRLRVHQPFITCAVLQLLQIRGPLKLAVESGDLDFCSAALVRNLCEKVFTGTCILDSQPVYYERKVRDTEF